MGLFVDFIFCSLVLYIYPLALASFEILGWVLKLCSFSPKSFGYSSFFAFLWKIYISSNLIRTILNTHNNLEKITDLNYWIFWVTGSIFLHLLRSLISLIKAFYFSTYRSWIFFVIFILKYFILWCYFKMIFKIFPVVN